MSHNTEDPTADLLLQTLEFIRNSGTPNQKARLVHWEHTIRQNAEPIETPMNTAVNFATEEEEYCPEDLSDVPADGKMTRLITKEEE